MRYIKLFPLVLFTIVLALASCQDDDVTPDTPSIDNGETNVSFRLSVKNPTVSGSTTRAAVTEEGTSGEMMKNWIILAVRNDSIKKILTSESYEGERKEDSCYTRLSNGTYDFYSFANISLDSLGIKATDAKLPANFDKKAFHVEGNQQSVDGFTNGIPMSNKQTVVINSSTNLVSLEVIRMVVKVRVEVSNPTDGPLTVQSLAIREITKNPGKDTLNVGLLPGAISNSETGMRTPNIVPTRHDTIDRVTFVDSIPVAEQTIPAQGKREFTFYVNESAATNADSTQFLGKHFILEVRRGATEDGDSYSYNQRFVFTDWATMARNEIHILPVELQKYSIGVQVFPYTAIGVLPKYENDNNISTVFLGLYGHYDMVPKIIDYETGYCYYTYNTSLKQGFTVRSNGMNDRSGGDEVDDITISNLSLLTNSKATAILADNDYSGWGSNPDGSLKDGETPNLPVVGWNHVATAPRIECIVGNYTGWAIYTINATFTEKDNPQKQITVSHRLRISNTYFDLSSLAKRRR